MTRKPLDESFITSREEEPKFDPRVPPGYRGVYREITVAGSNTVQRVLIKVEPIEREDAHLRGDEWS